MLTRDGAVRMDLQAQERQNADMRQQRARRMDQVRRLLVETSEALAGSTNLRSSLNAVAHAAVTGLADWCLVDLLDEHGTLHGAAAAHADPRLQRTVEELHKRGASGRVRFDLVWEVLRGRQPRLESEVSELLRMALTVDAEHEALLQRLGFASLLVVPLLVADRVLGALTLVRGPHELRFNAEDVALADAWAHQCAQALHSVRRYAAERRAHRAAETRARERTAALEKIDDAVVIANDRGQFRFMNPAARALFGAAKPSSSTELPLLAENGQALEEAANPLTRAQRDRAHVGATELRIRRPDGTDAIVEAAAAPLPDGRAAAHGAVLSLHDVTAWRERERRRDESFANASHDLRTPVAAISGAIEVFLRDAPPGIPPPLYHMLLIIEQETARLRALVDDVLELTSVEAGRTRLRLTRLDLRALLRHSARAVEPLLKRRSQRIVLDLPRRPLRHTIDSQRLQRAVLNLLTNAQEHSPSGGTIWLGLERQEDEALLSIRDSGPGIPFEEQERIFERFYRAPGAAHHRGSGLGLPIAAAMVELHSGRIWVESAPGAGATFFIALPMPPRRRSVRKGAAKPSALAERPPL